MPRKVIRGTGITAREGVEYDAKAGEAPSHEHWNAAIEEGGGLFGAVSLQAARSCEHILANATGDIREDDPEAFAQTIANYIAYAKNEIQVGDADRAARFAFIAGMEWARATMKWAWEPDALRGEKVAGGRHNSAAQTNERHVPQRELRFSRMRELAPSIGADKAAAQCETEGLGTRAAIKRQWNRFHSVKKKRDT
jgi:hypothetical protein